MKIIRQILASLLVVFLCGAAHAAPDCQKIAQDYQYQEHKRPMSAAWKRVLVCIPGLMCDATCSDFDEYGQVLRENRAIERKWVFDCNGTFKTGNGQVVDKTNFDAHHDKIYKDYLKRRTDVCSPGSKPDSAKAAGHEWAVLHPNSELSTSVVWAETEEKARKLGEDACRAASMTCSSRGAATSDLNKVFVTVCCSKPRVGCQTSVAASAAEGERESQKTFATAGYSDCSLRKVLSARTGRPQNQR